MATVMIMQPVVLSGGSGTRLWPLSREHYPKQLLPLTGELTLLQETVDRLNGLPLGQLAPSLFVCNEEHRFLVAEQLRRVQAETGAILLEPFGRNTAPALTLAALAATAQHADAALLVMPADHIVQDRGAFQVVIGEGRSWVEQGFWVTFGIRPVHAETGYGYIELGETLPTRNADAPAPYQLLRFTEKPDAAVAQRYLESGRHLWNSGIFMMQASRWLQAVGRQHPDMAEACRQAFAQGRQDGMFFRVDSAAFAASPSQSIDYAVMEKLHALGERAVVIPLDAGWSDVGAWASLWGISTKSTGGNVTRGDVIAHDVRDSLLLAQHRMVAAVGVADMIVIETADAVLVIPRDRAQDVKVIVEYLKAVGRPEYVTHRRVYRPWGSYECLDQGERFQVKRIIVNPRAALSLQMHHHRAEHWIVVRGTARVTRGEKVFLLAENQSTYMPLGVTHRLENPGLMPLEIVEVQSGSYLGEDDIVRFDDAYGREGDAGRAPLPAGKTGEGAA